MLTEKRDNVVIVMKRAEKELDTDKLISRRDDTSLQDTATIITAAREVEEEEEEDVIIRAVLSQSVDTTVFIFN
ncbi:hypothetical protein BDBG_17452 [Blastomyces gilchristii SLH14081]|uniref:Uncharacterized protein n=1 Tax=Blastomyces gilchristii (strain SLH14081) TaxID=559298 RepID=A0A179UTK8_BLAGS|nr:uncharacterized protein BDBG_17452 [Blastomyces gilchristii SLH14081]OAT11190.1 hypothetical protein BDBG_17452 [Blastomyces gilchristii SLH14081]